MIRRPQGLTDQLAHQIVAQQELLQTLQKHLAMYGYQIIETPLVEQADLFLTKAGDSAINRLITFDVLGKTLCLRTEFTAPAARAYIEQFESLPGAVRLQFGGSVLHYENVAHNQLMQRLTVGGELLNEHSASADAEVIALAGQLLQKTGLVDDWQLIIGHTGFVDRLLAHFALNRQLRRFVFDHLADLRGDATALEAVQARLDAYIEHHNLRQETGETVDTENALRAMLQTATWRGTTGQRSPEEIMRRLLSKHQQSAQYENTRQALHLLHTLVNAVHNPKELLAHPIVAEKPHLHEITESIIKTFAFFAGYDLPAERIRFDLSFTRSLDYYTGIVFEYRAHGPGIPDQRRLLSGGGRYDELVEILGAEHSVPAVGFALDLDNLLYFLYEKNGSYKEAAVHVLVFTQQEADALDLQQVAAVLRNKGIVTTTSLTPSPQAFATENHTLYTHTMTRLPDGDQYLLKEIQTDRITTGTQEELIATLTSSRELAQ